MRPTLPRRLIERAQSGDASARAELIRQWLPSVIQWATRLTGPRVDPEDIAQEVFLVALTKLHTVRDTERIAPWLYGVTRKIISKHHRRAWLIRWVGPPEEESEGLVFDPVVDFDNVRHVRELLQRVPLKQREVLVLMCIEERTAGEVADLLGIAEGTVRSRLRLGKQRLRQLLQESGLARAGLPSCSGSTVEAS